MREESYMVIAIVLTGFIAVVVAIISIYVIVQDIRLRIKDKNE